MEVHWNKISKGVITIVGNQDSVAKSTEIKSPLRRDKSCKQPGFSGQVFIYKTKPLSLHEILKILLPLIVWEKILQLRDGWFSLRTDSFSFFKSTHILTWSLSFGATTIGAYHSVVSSILEITLKFCILSNSAFTMSLCANGTLRGVDNEYNFLSRIFCIPHYFSPAY